MKASVACLSRFWFWNV